MDSDLKKRLSNQENQEEDWSSLQVKVNQERGLSVDSGDKTNQKKRVDKQLRKKYESQQSLPVLQSENYLQVDTMGYNNIKQVQTIEEPE